MLAVYVVVSFYTVHVIYTVHSLNNQERDNEELNEWKVIHKKV